MSITDLAIKALADEPLSPFEILIATRKGQILHGCLLPKIDDCDKGLAMIEVLDKFEKVLTLGSGMEICDIEIAKFTRKVTNEEG